MENTKEKKKIALNVYLLKVNLETSSKGVYTEKEFLARPVGPSRKPQLIKTEKHLLGSDGQFGTLFIKKPVVETEPEWIGFVQKGLVDTTPLSKLKNQSVSALLVVEQDARQFAIAFGHGRFMIEPRLIEERFGIRVVLNSISPEKISSIDRQTFDASPRISRTQTIRASSVSDYMISAQQDLLRGLVGFTKPQHAQVLGKVIAGIDSFKTSIAIDVSELGGLLSAALDRSESKDYLALDAYGNSSEFAWVENLLPVRDKTVIEELEEKLWAKLRSSDLTDMWLAVPDIVDWSEVTGFSYNSAASDDEIETTLDLAKFLTTLRKNATMTTVKHREILMQMASGGPPQRLNAFRCLYAEIEDKLELFILNVGTWFKVDRSFQASVENYFNDLPRKPAAHPFTEYAHEGEGPYNDAVGAASPSTHAVLDRRMIRFGGSYDKIEVCDVFKRPGTGQSNGSEFIHVKRGRGSATLSHLFAQGLVASTLLVKESKFVTEVNKQLKSQKFPPLPTKFYGNGHEVVFAIIDGPAGKPLDLPFFSKVTLQNAGRSISAFGYTVHIMHIPESSAHLAAVATKQAIKKASKKAGNKAKTPKVANVNTR